MFDATPTSSTASEPEAARRAPAQAAAGTAKPLQRTPLYEIHVALGAKMVPFAGFEMPVQYPTGITAEHKAVRENAGVLDVSHMGEFIVRGKDALAFASLVTSN